MTLSKKIPYLFLISLAFISNNIKAEVILDGTRKVYPANNKEITLQLDNVGKQSSLIQAWIDNGDPNAKPSQVNVPFLITPPMARIDAGKGQALRIMSLPESSRLPQDKETLFWLNVLDIPPTPDKNNSEVPENYLQMAIRSRIKFIYRPESLVNYANKAPEKLEWFKSQNGLKVKNPTAYFITISKIEDSTKLKNFVPNGIMLEPFSETAINAPLNDINSMTYTTINDLGARIKHTLKIK